jgi:hypothetical protein
VPNPPYYDLRLEPGVSGIALAVALEGWLQRECGAVTCTYDLEGNVVSILLLVSAHRLALARTRFGSAPSAP